MRKLIAAILAAFILFSVVSCADGGQGTLSTTDISSTNTTAPVSTECDVVTDDVPELDFGGYEFRVLSRELSHMHTAIVRENEVGEVLNDAIYKRNRTVENRFNFKMTEVLNADENYARSFILAGDDTFDIINARCTAALNFWKQDLIYLIDDIPYIDLSKPYWDQSLNPSLTLNGVQYVAMNALNLTIYDLTQCLLFNKDMIKKYGLEDPYQLVKNGKWTFDKFNEMMKPVVSDLNGDQKMDGADQYGLVSNPKNVLPNMWIAAGTLSITKNENDHPYVSMGDEKYISVIQKVFEIMWDNGNWYTGTVDDANVPTDTIDMFSAGQSLFMDTYFFYIDTLRNMESDFGIVPYPKYNESQERYITRVHFYDTFVVPVTNTDLARTGAIIEALSCDSYNTVIPAYYDVALKTKYARDEESTEMLDLIFANRVIDLGDTVWVGEIRDGVLAPMFRTNKRDIMSKLESIEKKVTASIDKIPMPKG